MITLITWLQRMMQWLHWLHDYNVWCNDYIHVIIIMNVIIASYFSCACLIKTFNESKHRTLLTYPVWFDSQFPQLKLHRLNINGCKKVVQSFCYWKTIIHTHTVYLYIAQLENMLEQQSWITVIVHSSERKVLVRNITPPFQDCSTASRSLHLQ